MKQDWPRVTRDEREINKGPVSTEGPAARRERKRHVRAWCANDGGLLWSHQNDAHARMTPMTGTVVRHLRGAQKRCGGFEGVGRFSERSAAEHHNTA